MNFTETNRTVRASDGATIVEETADAIYTGQGEFYSGVREDEVVKVVRRTIHLLNGTVYPPTSYSIQSVEHPGPWLTVYLSNVDERLVGLT